MPYKLEHHPLKGCRVRILNHSKYKGACYLAVGEVKVVYANGSIAVTLDGLTNSYSASGFYYFKDIELEILNETQADTATNIGGNTMNITNYLNTAVISFLNESTPFRTYEYANFDPDLKAGDLCVVMSAHHGMGLAEVVEIKADNAKALKREIVAKVDATAYYNRVEVREKAALLKSKMQERAKQLQDIVLFQTLAKEDESMSELLEAYKALGV